MRDELKRERFVHELHEFDRNECEGMRGKVILDSGF
jgi:hypothetical protein